MNKLSNANIIFKNFSSLAMAHIIYKILTFIMMVAMARFLGPEGFGQFSYGLSFAWAFLFISDFGLADLFTRDVTHQKSLLNKYVNNIITLKIFISLASFLTILVLAWRFSFGITKFWIITLLGASVCIDSYIYFFRSLFRVRETMEYEAILIFIESILKLGTVLLCIRLRTGFPGAILVSLALFSVSVVNFLINLATFFRNYHKFIFSFEKDFWLYLVKSGLPFALVYVLSLINFRVDIIMLSLMNSDKMSGLYNANFKLIEQFLLIPFTFSYVLLPTFSRLSRAAQSLKELLVKIIPTVSFLSIFSLFVCALFGKFFLKVIYGLSFQEAGQYLYLFSWVLLPFFFKPVIEKLLFGLRKQFLVCKIYLFGVFLKIILNLILIPKLGISGASLGTVFSETLTVALTIIILFRIFPKADRNAEIEDENIMAELSY